MAKRERLPAIPPVTAVEELGTIKEVLLLHLLLTVFDRDAKIIAQSQLKTSGPYVDLVQRAMDAVTKDLAKLRNRLREHGIKITDERKDEQGVGCVYWCRGYKSSFEMLWHFVKAETEIRMRKYLGEDIRKYVRNDLPEHLRPTWLLEPVPGSALDLLQTKPAEPPQQQATPASVSAPATNAASDDRQ